MARRKRLTPPSSQPNAPADALKANLRAFESAPVDPTATGGVSVTPLAPVARVAGDQAQAAALQELSEEVMRARQGGRMVLELPLETIEAEHLIRDRLSADADQMEALKQSLAASGQRAPVEVMELGNGRYGLISGWRRITALRALRDEGRAGGTVLALLRRPEDRAAAYRAMVEENEIRADLSYYERARITLKAVEAGVFETERDALQSLFGAASRARRSKIGSFLPIVRALDGVLCYPSALPERLGLKLSQALREDDAFEGKLRHALGQGVADSEAERALLEAAVTHKKPARSNAKRDTLTKVVPKPGSPQVVLSRDRAGRVVLDGPGVTKAFITRLEAWIESGVK